MATKKDAFPIVTAISGGSVVGSTRISALVAALVAAAGVGSLMSLVACEKAPEQGVTVQTAATTATEDDSNDQTTAKPEQSNEDSGKATRFGSAEQEEVSTSVNRPAQSQDAQAKTGVRPDDAPPSAPIVAGEILFEETAHDFGKVAAGETVNCKFKFTNNSKDPIVIERVRSSCGCTVPELKKKEYEAGEAGEIEVAFSPKGFGRQTKTITVVTNVQGQERQLLTVSADAVEVVRTSPKMAQFGDVLKGTTPSIDILLESIDPNFQVLGVEVDGGGEITAQIVDRETDVPASKNMAGSAVLEVKISESVPLGRVLRKVIIKTKAAMEGEVDQKVRELELSAFANVVGDLKASPMAIRLPTIDVGQDFESSAIVALRSGKEFKITDLSIEKATIPGVRVWSEPYTDESTKGHRVFIKGNTTDFKGVYRGFVKVTTDVPGEEPMLISFSGAVRTTGPTSAAKNK